LAKGLDSAALSTFLEISPAQKAKREVLGIFGKIVFKKGVKREKSKRKVRIVRGREQKGKEGILLL
jgi:hypothetical protein